MINHNQSQVFHKKHSHNTTWQHFVLAQIARQIAEYYEPIAEELVEVTSFRQDDGRSSIAVLRQDGDVRVYDTWVYAINPEFGEKDKRRRVWNLAESNVPEV